MKKFAALALSLTLLFSASSCIASPVSPDTLSESMTEQEGTNLCEPTPTDPITPESSQPIDTRRSSSLPAVASTPRTPINSP